MILATSDKQLLLQGDLAIPILNFAVPVTTIYVVMPPLYMIVHFYMLLQLSLLVPKITKFGDRCVKLKSRQVQKPLLLPFVFNERVLRWDNRGSVKLIVSFQVVLTLFVLPLFLTIGIQYRYLPMHNWDMTYYHMGMSLAHLLMVLYFAYSLGFLSKWVAKTKALLSTVFYSLTVIFVLEPTTKPMELTNFSTFWLQNTTFPLKYGKCIYTQSYIFRAKIEKTTSIQSFVVGSNNLVNFKWLCNPVFRWGFQMMR